jgi:hypothetical protein
MATATTLHEYLDQLKQGPVAVVPASAEWKPHVDDISVPGRICEVTEEDFYYWLDVLPPKWLVHYYYCFGEGADPFRLFWKSRGRFFCRQLTDEETDAFCRLAGMPRPT